MYPLPSSFNARQDVPFPLAAVLLSCLLLGSSVASGQPLAVQWGTPVQVDFDGPATSEDAEPNPFRDIRFEVTFTHDDTGEAIVVPAYFAADGNAAESGAEEGSTWRVHFIPNRTGRWTYETSVRTGSNMTVRADPDTGEAAAGHGFTGVLEVRETSASGPGFLRKGILRHHKGDRYLRFDDGTYFLKGGADSPENFLAYAGFDDTYSLKAAGTEQEGEARTAPLHRYEPHVADWKPGDPTWRDGRGKGIIGALNYLASEGMNSAYFLMMNVEGDGDDVWPWIDPDVRDRFDVSKLDQWNRVFDHMDRLGIKMHVVLTETENETLFERYAEHPTAFADERKLYYRELIARFGHHPALVWNLGEENGWDDRSKTSTGESGTPNTDDQRRAFASYIRELDPYDHPIVVHTFPGDHDVIYEPLLGFADLDGPSLQVGNMKQAHEATLKWLEASRKAGHPWFVSVDEIGPANAGVTPDGPNHNHDDVRRYVLWGNLMAGGAGVEWYFGYDAPQNDLNAEDWRSRDAMWDYTRHALAFFHDHLPFREMNPDDALASRRDAYVFAKPGSTYAVYVPTLDETHLNVSEGVYEVRWYNPRTGGALQSGTLDHVTGPGWQDLGRVGTDSNGDWAILIKRIDH